jgi:hypothetical protein
MHVAVHPQVRPAILDQGRHVGRVAPGQVGVPVRQAVRVRGVMGHDDGRTGMRYRERLGEERPRGPMHVEHLGRLDAVARPRPRADAAVVDHAASALGGAEGVRAGVGAEQEVRPQRAAEEARPLDHGGAVHQERDPEHRSQVASALRLVGDRVSLVAAVPPEVVVARHVDDRDAGEALGQPVEGAQQRHVHVAGDDGHVEAAGRRLGGRVPGVPRPVLVEVGEDPEAGHVPSPARPSSSSRVRICGRVTGVQPQQSTPTSRLFAMAGRLPCEWPYRWRSPRNECGHVRWA